MGIILLAIAVSLLVHVVGAPMLARWIAGAGIPLHDAAVAIRTVEGDPLDALDPTQRARLLAAEAAIRQPEPDPTEPEEEPEEPEPKLPDGQIVETPRPTEEQTPAVADYLAEHDNAVPVETRSERFKINPDVLSNMYSDEARLALEDVPDVGATEDSTGATVGTLMPPDAGRGAPRTAIASPWAFTNKEGLAAPVPSSSREQTLSGAPQNDLLDEKKGAVVALNTREFIGTAYLNRIRRQVNFYWDQNLDNLGSSVRISAPRYRTVVAIVLSADGVLESIRVTDDSGSPPHDDAVVDAFRIAGPFPNPPEQLVSKDGRVYLEDFSFEVQYGQAQLDYSGIDPRAGVQFPGIMKAPR